MNLKIKSFCSNIHLKNDRIEIKGLFSSKIIDANNVRVAYITKLKTLNILTKDNEVISKTIHRASDKDKEVLKIIAKYLNKENIIIGSNKYKYAYNMNFLFLIYIFINARIIKLLISITILIILCLNIWISNNETYYLYNIENNSISVYKKGNLISIFNISDAEYHGLTSYDTVLSFKFKKKKFFLPKDITYPSRYIISIDGFLKKF